MIFVYKKFPDISLPLRELIFKTVQGQINTMAIQLERPLLWLTNLNGVDHILTSLFYCTAL